MKEKSSQSQAPSGGTHVCAPWDVLGMCGSFWTRDRKLSTKASESAAQTRVPGYFRRGDWTKPRLETISLSLL